MSVIKLTHNDLNEMVRRTIHSILKESVKEVQGSIMAEKENVVQEIVDYIAKEWERIKTLKPINEGPYTFDNEEGVRFKGLEKDYIILVPQNIVQKLGISEQFDLNVAVKDFNCPPEMEKYFTIFERGTEGSSYAGPKYSKFIRTSLKVSESRIDIYVPSINGELQVRGLHSTLYHELNHAASRLELQRKHAYLSDEELENLRFDTASQRKENHPHFLTQNVLHPENDPLEPLRGLFMDEDDKKTEEIKKKIAFVFYSIWETTERNARAEAMYGDLKALNATRENFNSIYPQTELYAKIQEIEEILDMVEKLQVPSKIWPFVGKVMGMQRRGKNNSASFQAMTRYQEAIKERFLSRSRELLNILFKKGTKVAELYFQRTEPKKGPSKLERCDIDSRD